MPSIEINGRRIQTGCPVYVIAELSANHHQNFEDAVRLIHAAKESGADAVKLQTYTPDTITISSDQPCFRIGGGTIWDGETLYDLYARAYTPWEWQLKLKHLAGELGMDLFSTPFDSTAVDWLEAMQVPAYKIASFELTDVGLIRRVATTGKPVIMSTGMATLSEIEEAVEAARSAGATQLALLKCTSAYPSPADEMNLLTIPHLSQAFGVPVGLSDHTLTVSVPVTAVTLGACIVEKHLTLSRAVHGPDSAFSLELQEFKTMVDAIRSAERSLGAVHYGPSADEEKSRIFRRSLFVVEDVKCGEFFSSANVRSIRPAHGLHPRHLDGIIGRRAAQDILRGTPLSWELIGGGQMQKAKE
jgi:pseudaminic acid synthase